MSDETPGVEVGGARLERGQVIMPLPKRAVFTMTPQDIADAYVPIMLAEARENGGTLTGTPEILRYEEIKPRMESAGRELLDLVERHRDGYFVLATMVPHDWTEFDRGRPKTIETVARPRLHPARRRN